MQSSKTKLKETKSKDIDEGISSEHISLNQEPSFIKLVLRKKTEKLDNINKNSQENDSFRQTTLSKFFMTDHHFAKQKGKCIF